MLLGSAMPDGMECYCSPVVYNSTESTLLNGITTPKGSPDAWVNYLGRGAIIWCVWEATFKSMLSCRVLHTVVPACRQGQITLRAAAKYFNLQMLPAGHTL